MDKQAPKEFDNTSEQSKEPSETLKEQAFEAIRKGQVYVGAPPKNKYRITSRKGVRKIFLDSYYQDGQN